MAQGFVTGTHTTDQFLSRGAINAGRVKYPPSQHAKGEDWPSFTFKVGNGIRESAAGFTENGNGKKLGP